MNSSTNQFGSFGLTSTESASSNIFTPDNAPRYTGRTSVPNVLTPAMPTLNYPAFPSVDPLAGGFTYNSNGIDGDIKTPYSIVADLSIQRQLRGAWTLEVDYVGRFGRHLLQQLDLAQSTDLVDKKSGMDYFTAARLMSQIALAHGEATRDASNNLILIPPIQYFEDLFPTAAAGGFSATQNIYTGPSACPSGDSCFSWANRPGREIGAPFRLGLICSQLAHGGVTPVCNGLPPSNLVQTAPVRAGLFRNVNGPSAFADAEAVAAATAIIPNVPATLAPLRFPFPGEAGSRNNFRGPGFFGIDMGLAKNWKIHESMGLKFAWEVFNVTNSVRFDVNPNTSLDNGIADGPAFGLYRKTLTAPRVQQFSLRIAF